MLLSKGDFHRSSSKFRSEVTSCSVHHGHRSDCRSCPRAAPLPGERGAGKRHWDGDGFSWGSSGTETGTGSGAGGPLGVHACWKGSLEQEGGEGSRCMCCQHSSLKWLSQTKAREWHEQGQKVTEEQLKMRRATKGGIRSIPAKAFQLELQQADSSPSRRLRGLLPLLGKTGRKKLNTSAHKHSSE